MMLTVPMIPFFYFININPIWVMSFQSLLLRFHIALAVSNVFLIHSSVHHYKSRDVLSPAQTIHLNDNGNTLRRNNHG